MRYVKLNVVVVGSVYSTLSVILCFVIRSVHSVDSIIDLNNNIFKLFTCNVNYRASLDGRITQW